MDGAWIPVAGATIVASLGFVGSIVSASIRARAIMRRGMDDAVQSMRLEIGESLAELSKDIKLLRQEVGEIHRAVTALETGSVKVRDCAALHTGIESRLSRLESSSK
jgi:hypothetical protein